MSKGHKGYYAEWEPQPHVLAVVEQAQAVLAEYEAYLPLTLRQVFYRLVARFGFEKTEQAYKRLSAYLANARRAGLIEWGALRDDGIQGEVGVLGWDQSPERFWEEVEEQAESYARCRSEGQPVRIEVWSETAGMLPQIQAAVPRGVYAVSAGGQPGCSVPYGVAQRVRKRAEEGVRTVLLHVGDHDPGGVCIYESMIEDVAAYVTEDGFAEFFEPVRLLLTPAQISEYDLSTVPPKTSDSRTKGWIGGTCQAEALDPADLARIVREACEERIDQKALAKVRKREKAERRQVTEEVVAAIKAGAQTDDRSQ
jgi:hypothetical protein